MKNQLILYNPYYQNDVIEQHLDLLIKNGEVPFGKIRSTLKTMEHQFLDEIHKVYETIDETNFLQLFLTDYLNIYVAKVIKVTSFDKSSIAPSYYKEKNLDVEKWFIISDMREIVRDDFESVREDILSNFTTPNFNNRSYAIYGNSYVYPLAIDMKQEINYFENTDLNYYTDMFKSKRHLEIKENLAKYSFGLEYLNHMHPNSLDNIISAQIEYDDNITNPLYDFSSVVIKYAKTIEQEVYLFAKALFSYLIQQDNSLCTIPYSIQSTQYLLKDILTHKPNLGTYGFLIRNYKIKDAIQNYLDKDLSFFVTKTFPNHLRTVQSIRNETVHGNAPSISEVTKLQANIIGIAKQSILIDLVKHRVDLKYLK